MSTSSFRIIAAVVLAGVAASAAQGRELRRSEVEAIARQEARRAAQSRAQSGAPLSTDALRVGPQGRPTTTNGNGTTVVPNR